MNVKKKIGPFSLWVWALLAVALVVAFWYYRKRSAGTTPTTSTDILTTGVLPQGVSQAGAPSTTSAPSSGLSPDVQDALSSQFADVNAALSGLSAQQSQQSTDLQSQADAAAQRESDLNAAVNTLGASTADTFAQLFTMFSPPAVSTPTATPTPVDITIHLAKQKAAAAKPTVAKPKQKPKKTVTKPGAKVPKKKVTRH